MAYTALYRKFRPQTFSDVKGQEHIVKTLTNELKADRIGHAYLFVGTRGTGKTSVAKIFAKAVNCEDPREDGSPCGVCPSCTAASDGSSLNVIEMDAASNNGVEDIRGIIDEVAYAPTEGRYKVYIIDEVHMLSGAAFNALLKTLEEPPAYVIFILATTEVHKVPITILSRCQRYDFRRISIDTIADRLSELMKTEQIDVEDRALRYIAKAADGSMRDALSLLDQCIAFYMNETLTYEKALDVLGAVDAEVFSKLLRCIIKKDAYGAIRCIDEVVMAGRELVQFVTDFTWYIRNLLLVKGIDDLSEILDMSEDNLNLLREEAEMVDTEVLHRYIRVLSELLNQMRFSSQKRVLLEVAVLKLCRPQTEEDNDSLVDRIAALEMTLQNGAFVPAVLSGQQGGMAYGGAGSGDGGAATASFGDNASGAGVPIKPATPEKKKLPEAVPEDVKRACAEWKSIIQSADPMIMHFLKKAYVTVLDDGKLTLVYDTIDAQQFMAYADLARAERIKEIEELIAEHLGVHVPVAVISNASNVKSEKMYENAVDVFLDAVAENGNVTIETEDF